MVLDESLIDVKDPYAIMIEILRRIYIDGA